MKNNENCLNSNRSSKPSIIDDDEDDSRDKSINKTLAPCSTLKEISGSADAESVDCEDPDSSEVQPPRRRIEFKILETDLIEKFCRGSGPGGQAMQKTSNCVRLKHWPTGVAVRVHDTRSLEQNRRIARKRLRFKLDEYYNQELSYTAQKQNSEKLKNKSRERKIRLKYGSAPKKVAGQRGKTSSPEDTQCNDDVNQAEP